MCSRTHFSDVPRATVGAGEVLAGAIGATGGQVERGSVEAGTGSTPPPTTPVFCLSEVEVFQDLTPHEMANLSAHAAAGLRRHRQHLGALAQARLRAVLGVLEVGSPHVPLVER